MPPGYVAGIPDSQFSSPAQLGAVLAKSAQCQECMVKQYFRYIAGPAGDAGGSSGDSPVARRFPEVAVSLQRADSVDGSFEGISQHQEGLFMSQVITKRVRISRRALLKGLTAAGSQIVVGLPPLVSMFNSHGTAYAAETPAGAEKPIESRFVLWFNGNGIPERYWIPSEEGARLRDDAVPLAAGAVPSRYPRAERRRQRRRERHGQRSHQFDERPDDRAPRSPDAARADLPSIR